MNISGSYRISQALGQGDETLRIDVDGQYPQMAASGTLTQGLQQRLDWLVQPLALQHLPTGDVWSGPIVHTVGNTSLLPYHRVELRVTGARVEATFLRSGLPDRKVEYDFVSPFFHEVEMEFDAEAGASLILDYDTHSHADRPASLAQETLTIQNVFERAGFRVQRTGGDSVVPHASAGIDNVWNDNEMHDAMQTHFSVLANLPPAQRDRARWALWTFFAGRHQDGVGLGGIMFDSIGQAQRQGTAIFTNSFIANSPTGDIAPAAWQRRMAFWTAVHEMGHAFNLQHSWLKGLVGPGFNPWMPMTGGADLLTFMNYPFRFENGAQPNSNTVRFFRRFDFRFTDDELLFLRHAPEHFVQMGAERFGANHAFEQARLAPYPSFKLEVRVNRPKAEFEFMEPVVIEMKLTNSSDQPQLVPEHILKSSDQMTVLVARRGGEPHAFHPFAHYCHSHAVKVLMAGESMYESLFLSAGHEQWLIDDPGYYEIQICLHLPAEDILSPPLEVRVTPPKDRTEEYVSQDYFSEDVGRVLAFDGSQVLTGANNTLMEVCERCPDARVTEHAKVALSMPRIKSYKLLRTGSPAAEREIGEPVPVSDKQIVEVKSDEKMLTDLASQMETDGPSNMLAQTLGHIDYRYYAESVCQALVQHDLTKSAQTVATQLHDTLKARGALPRVLAQLMADAKELGAGSGKTKKASKGAKKK